MVVEKIKLSELVKSGGNIKDRIRPEMWLGSVKQYPTGTIFDANIIYDIVQNIKIYGDTHHDEILDKMEQDKLELTDLINNINDRLTWHESDVQGVVPNVLVRAVARRPQVTPVKL